MTELQRTAVLLKLAEDMRANGSWCGETHLQKATYLLQEMLRVPTDFDFVLYKHGPFSFDLRDELTGLRADGLLEMQVKVYPYSPSLQVTRDGSELCRKFPRTLGRYSDHIEFVSRKLSNAGVAQLERLGTALYVSMKLGPEAAARKRTDLLKKLKPHVGAADAMAAVKQIDTYLKEAETLFNQTQN